MNNIVNIVHDIIGNEKGIANIIVNYFYIETIIDNSLENIDVTHMLNGSYIERVPWLRWLDSNYSPDNYFCITNEKKMCDVYKIINKKIEPVCFNIDLQKMNIWQVKKMIILDNMFLIIGYDEFDSIVKYDSINKYICYTLKFPQWHVVDVMKHFDHIIIIGKNIIYKYNYNDGKEIYRKHVKFNGEMVFAGTNIVSVNATRIYVIDINTLNIKTIMLDKVNGFTHVRKRIGYLKYDYTNDNVIAHNVDEDEYLVYNIQDMSIKKYDRSLNRFNRIDEPYYYYSGGTSNTFDHIKKRFKNRIHWVNNIDIYCIYAHNIVKQIIFKDSICDLDISKSPNGRYIIYVSASNMYLIA